MRAAADREDGSVKHVAMENRLYPMRELLGELLLEIGQPAAGAARVRGLAQGEPESLSRSLRRGARRGSRRRPAESGAYFEKLVALSSNADTTRPEVAHAKAFLGRR